MLNPRSLGTAVVIGLSAGMAIAFLLARVLENRFIYFPPRYPEGFPSKANPGPNLQEVWLTASDGVRLNAFFLAQPDSPQVLLCFHGNATNIGYGLAGTRTLASLGINILAMDYRGYGKSEGSPGEAGLYRDADAAYLYLTAQHRFAPQSIFVYGHSLGGAVAIDLASRRECGGLIAESTFTSGPDMARRMFSIPLFAYFAKTRFDSIAKIPHIHAPLLLIHGTLDAVVPLEMGRRLYRAAAEPKCFLAITGGGHNDLLDRDTPLYCDTMRRLLDGQLVGHQDITQ
jgi:uncharacterized protein